MRRAEHLSYAFMGSVYHVMFLHYKNHAVVLVSLSGGRGRKRHRLTKEGVKMLKPKCLNFVATSKADIPLKIPLKLLVCDGIRCNVILKRANSMRGGDVSMAQARSYAHSRCEGWRIPFLAKNAIGTIKGQDDYEEYGGIPRLLSA